MLIEKTKVYTLIKLISFVKFGCKDYESKYFANSPIVGEILKELELELGLIVNFEIEIDTPLGRNIIEAINFHISNTEQWDEMDIESKKTYIKDLANPYVFKEEDFQLFL